MLASWPQLGGLDWGCGGVSLLLHLSPSSALKWNHLHFLSL